MFIYLCMYLYLHNKENEKCIYIPNFSKSKRKNIYICICI